MSFGGDPPQGNHRMLASAADREAAQAVLKQAFEDERLTQDEFEARVGQAVAARTQGELAALTADLPAPAPTWAPAVLPRPRRRGRIWVPVAGIGVLVLAGAGLLVTHVSSSGTAPRASVAAQPGPASLGPGGPARCPVGTSKTALTIANHLARDPVYAEPSSGLLTTARAGQLRAEIGRADPGRIRIAVVTLGTVRRGGGERALANAIASCPADAAGTLLLNTRTATYVVTSYTDNSAATQAVGAALNTHASLATGLVDAVRRLAVVDNRRN